MCSTAHPPISIRLSDRTYEILSAKAIAQHRSVGHIIREFAEAGAAELRRAAIRAEAEAVASRYRSNAEVREFYDDVVAAGAEAVRKGLPAEEDPATQ